MKFFVFLLLFFPSCASDETEKSASADTIVIGEGDTFVNPDVTASAGEVLAVINHDDTPHSITSESAAGAFDDTGDFDILIPSEGEQLLELPQAPEGTVYFFYCRLHEDLMLPADGTITIE